MGELGWVDRFYDRLNFHLYPRGHVPYYMSAAGPAFEPWASENQRVVSGLVRNLRTAYRTGYDWLFGTYSHPYKNRPVTSRLHSSTRKSTKNMAFYRRRSYYGRARAYTPYRRYFKQRFANRRFIRYSRAI